MDYMQAFLQMASSDEKTRTAISKMIVEDFDKLSAFVSKSLGSINARDLSFVLAQASKKPKNTQALQQLLFGNDNAVLGHIAADLLASGAKTAVSMAASSAIEGLVNKAVGERDGLLGDAKARKNLYITLGNLATKQALAVLLRAADSERTFFVLPSLILALGNFKDQAADAIKKIKALTLQSQVAPKIKEQISQAMQKVKNKGDGTLLAQFSGFSQHQSLLLSTMRTQKNVLRQDLAALNLPVFEVDEGFVVYTDDTERVFGLRTFYDCLLYSDSLYKIDKSQLEYNLIQFLRTQNLPALHNSDTLNYRISAFALQKKQVIADVSKAIEQAFGETYVNNPHNYSIEIQIFEQKNDVKCFVKLCTMQDSRFDYRTQFLPASINPCTAAIIVRLCEQVCKAPHIILDPFCGTSTLLIEAGKVFDNANLVGVDFDASALKKSRQNADNARTKLALVHTDICKFTPTTPAHLVISNMPFGTRVGTHNSNTKLYAKFFSRLPEFMAPGAIAALYTTEIKLMQNLIHNSPQFGLLAAHKMYSGDMEPTLFVLKRN